MSEGTQDERAVGSDARDIAEDSSADGSVKMAADAVSTDSVSTDSVPTDSVPADSGVADSAEDDVVAADSVDSQVKAAASEAVASEAVEDEICRAGMQWYVLRVASNREDRVRDGLERKITIEGLDTKVGRILVPTLKEKKFKAGHVKLSERKLYPGYVFVEMATEDDGSIPDDVWFTIKESSGVGDFIASAGKPIPMPEHDVVQMLAACEQSEEPLGLSGLDLSKGQQVKITEGSFENFEGDVEKVDERRGMVTVMLEVFGRATPVEVEYWQLEKL